MKYKGSMLKKEREMRSRAARILSGEEFVQGGLVTMRRTCGKPNCKCATKGEKHVSLYLSCKYNGKRTMVYISPEKEEEIKRGVSNYKQIKSCMEKVSDVQIKKIANGKK